MTALRPLLPLGFVAIFASIALGLTSCSDDEVGFKGASSSATTTTTSSSDASTTATSASGTGGAGGEGATGTGGQGGQGGNQSQGGGGGQGQCTSAADCPVPGIVCFEATCASGVCSEGFSPALSPAGDSVPGDCLALVCDGAGATTQVPVLDDPSDDLNDCTLDACDNGAPSHLPLPSKTPCSAGVCNGLGACVQCVDAADCPNGGCVANQCGGCPAGMVDVGTHCIDATEVTVAAYLGFLGGPDPGQNAECAWNVSYVPSGGAPASSQLPITKVDYCDAAAYCKSAGKRLCGKIGGGATPVASYADPAVSQWLAACSSDGANAYPYGAAFVAGTCNGSGSGFGAPVAVQSLPGCKGPAAPESGIYDMSGNVWEWEDSCSGSTGATDTCRLRGGSFNNPMGFLGCSADYNVQRQAAFTSVGFRCCSP